MIIDQLFENNKKPLNEVDPRNFDSDEDFYAAQNAPAKPRYRGQQSPGVNPDDEDYFREIFRKKREAAKKAEQDGQHGVEEARVGNRMSDIEIGSPKIVHYKGKAVGEVGIDHEASPGNGQYYMKHYLSGKDMVGYNTKQEALAELKYIVQQMNEGLVESDQLDELSFKDIQRGANKFAKGANKFTKNVADTGAAVGNAASALGGAVKQVGKTAIADPVAATYNATKSGLNKAANVAANTYNDVKAGVQKVGQAGATVGTDLGNAAKAVGRGAANVAGGAAGALGSVAGGATTGVGRAAANGFNTGVQNVGGNAVDKLQTNVMARKPKEIKQEIDSKKKEITNLETELEKAIVSTTGGQAERPWAVASVNPATGKQWTPSELQATTQQAAPAFAAPQAGQPSAVKYGQGFAKPAAPKPTSVPNYGQKTPGYNYTTSVSPTATPAVTKVTAGGPTPAEKAALDKRIAAASAAQPVAETVKQVKRMMETVTSRADVQRIKDYIDYHMGSNLTESAQLKRNALLSEVTQLAATRRREIASRMV